mgnify:CR=1 FL=1
MQLTGCKRKGRDRHQFLVDMYLDPICRYQRWLGTNLEDADLSVELESIKGQDEEIFERFYRDLAFGTLLIDLSYCPTQLTRHRISC